MGVTAKQYPVWDDKQAPACGLGRLPRVRPAEWTVLVLKVSEPPRVAVGERETGLLINQGWMLTELCGRLRVSSPRKTTLGARVKGRC